MGCRQQHPWEMQALSCAKATSTRVAANDASQERGHEVQYLCQRSMHARSAAMKYNPYVSKQCTPGAQP
eukprot:1161215-Pelagomonas_calceolata.AAC.19